MSDGLRPARRRDAGMTLPEVMISMVVIGIIATVITSSIIVTMRTEEGTTGRLNVATAEQSVGMWLPADLSSAVDASIDPADSPCAPSTSCIAGLDGSNALTVSFPDGAGGTSVVSYIYGPSGDGETYELHRVECTSGSCHPIRVLAGLDGPPIDEWIPGVTAVPDEVINVALPLQADAVDEEATDETSSARRIVVTIDGGGDGEGAGGGLNRISITAGGTELGELEASKVTGPSFLQASSRCGGPITVIVDDSGSIGSAGASSTVENAVVDFVQALAGTPTQVQVVKFSTKSSLIDGSGAWNEYYDMTDPADVGLLAPDSGGLIRSGLVQSGGTNWEDAIYRTFYADTTALDADGRPVNLAADGNPATFLPKLVVFFTDGEPTFNRAYADPAFGFSPGNISSGGPLFPVGAEARDEWWPLAYGNVFDQEGWDRTSYLLSPFLHREDVRVIGIGVGAIATKSVFTFDEDDVYEIRNSSGYKRGIVYSNSYGSAYARKYSPSGSLPNNDGGTRGALSPNTPAEKVLGNLMVGVHPTVSGTPYVKATYNAGTDSWDNFDAETNLLSTSDFGALDDALVQIALGECGGTLTLQTKHADGSIAQSDVTYEVALGAEIQTVTTSQITRAAAVDMDFLPGVTQVSTSVTPSDLGAAGYTATGWSCSLRGAPLDSARWSVVDGDPAEGIILDVSANEAISCTMTVA